MVLSWSKHCPFLWGPYTWRIRLYVLQDVLTVSIVLGFLWPGLLCIFLGSKRRVHMIRARATVKLVVEEGFIVRPKRTVLLVSRGKYHVAGSKLNFRFVLHHRGILQRSLSFECQLKRGLSSTGIGLAPVEKSDSFILQFTKKIKNKQINKEYKIWWNKKN